ncbi:MAG TPA: glycosyl transferase [Stellaceae bacterium]|nr:glycosyl transferase [Stellaceae bacterium]
MTPPRGAAGDCDLIIVSAADSRYFPLLQDAVSSVRALQPAVALGVLDLGLTPDQTAWLAGQGAQLVRPGWDVDFPGQARTPDTLKAQVARPFLPRHFPGHATYLWLDADAWVQDWRAIEQYCAAASGGRLAIAIEIDRAYKRHYKRPKLFGTTLVWKNYREAFGWRVADRLGRNPMVNCGVFALQREAPHWAAWQRIIARVLRRTRFFYVEQIALNYAVFAEHLPVNLLPAYCNWLAGDAAPAFDAGRGAFVEPHAPHEAIGVMHLAGPEQKTQVFRLDRLEHGRFTGATVETSLRYGASRAVCRVSDQVID